MIKTVGKFYTDDGTNKNVVALNTIKFENAITSTDTLELKNNDTILIKRPGLYQVFVNATAEKCSDDYFSIRLKANGEDVKGAAGKEALTTVANIAFSVPITVSASCCPCNYAELTLISNNTVNISIAHLYVVKIA